MKKNITKKSLISFETKIANLYENKKIKGPIHLSGNNEEQLIKIEEMNIIVNIFFIDIL